MVCPNCGTFYSDNWTYCPDCEMTLEPSGECVECKGPTRPGEKLCDSCKERLVEEFSDYLSQLDQWVPCDETPVMFLKGGKLKIYSRRELTEKCKLFDPKKDRNATPKYGMLPHFYTCPVLVSERKEWAFRQRYKDA